MNAYYGNGRNTKDRGYMLYHVKDGKVLDIGCGDGEFLSMLKDFKKDKSEYYGVDKEDRLKCNDVKFYKEDVVSFLERNKTKFDTITLSSSLHEIYSYSYQHMNSEEFFIMFMDKLKPHLTEKGRIVIRDGVLKPKILKDVRFRVDLRSPINHFINYGLHSRMNRVVCYDRRVNKRKLYWGVDRYSPMDSKEGVSYTMDERTLYEFLMSAIWLPNGYNVFQKEVREVFGVYNKRTLDRLEGYNVLRTFEYYSDGYVPYIYKLVDNKLFDSTHQITVLENKEGE